MMSCINCPSSNSSKAPQNRVSHPVSQYGNPGNQLGPGNSQQVPSFNNDRLQKYFDTSSPSRPPLLSSNPKQNQLQSSYQQSWGGRNSIAAPSKSSKKLITTNPVQHYDSLPDYIKQKTNKMQQAGMYPMPMNAMMGGGSPMQQMTSMGSMPLTMPSMNQQQPYIMQSPMQMPSIGTKMTSQPMQIDQNVVTMPMQQQCGGMPDMSSMTGMTGGGMNGMNSGYPIYPMMNDNNNYPGLFAHDQYFDGSPMGAQMMHQPSSMSGYSNSSPTAAHNVATKRVSNMPPRSRR